MDRWTDRQIRRQAPFKGPTTILIKTLPERTLLVTLIDTALHKCYLFAVISKFIHEKIIASSVIL